MHGLCSRLSAALHPARACRRTRAEAAGASVLRCVPPSVFAAKRGFAGGGSDWPWNRAFLPGWRSVGKEARCHSAARSGGRGSACIALYGVSALRCKLSIGHHRIVGRAGLARFVARVVPVRLCDMRSGLSDGSIDAVDARAEAAHKNCGSILSAPIMHCFPEYGILREVCCGVSDGCDFAPEIGSAARSHGTLHRLRGLPGGMSRRTKGHVDPVYRKTNTFGNKWRQITSLDFPSQILQGGNAPA